MFIYRPTTSFQTRSRSLELSVLALSALAHLALLSLLSMEIPDREEIPIQISLLRERENTTEEKKPTMEKENPLPEDVKRLNAMEQIVTPPESVPTDKPVDTRFKSDFNAITKRESVKRGDGASNPISDEHPTTESKKVLEKRDTQRTQRDKKPVEKPAASKIDASPRNPALTLSDSQLTQTIPLSSDPTGESRSTIDNPRLTRDEPPSTIEARTGQLQRYRPFSKNSVALRPGVTDFLPSVPEGEITLLNTKADRFVVFVRRVATQVFGVLRRSQWRELPFPEIQKLSSMSTVEAILSPSGKVIAVKLTDGSGSNHFDTVLSQAVEQGVSDQNPPKEAAASDGNIHFIFKSRTWARPGSEGLGEQRWLLLGTGLL